MPKNHPGNKLSNRYVNLLLFAVITTLLLVTTHFAVSSEQALTAPKWIGINDDRGSVSLRWFRVQGAVQYAVLRRTGEKGEFRNIARVPNPGFNDFNVQQGQVYFYRVVPYGKEGAAGMVSETRYFKIEKMETLLLNPPVWIAHMVDTKGIALSWTHPRDKQVLAYNLYRRSEGDHDYTLLTSTPNTNYLDEAVQPEKPYQYVLTAMDMKLQETDYSEVLSASFTRVVKTDEGDEWYSSIKTLEEVIQFTEPVAVYNWEDYGFKSPTDLAYLHSEELLYVSDTATGLITVIGPDGNIINQLGGRGEKPDQFERLLGITLDQAGNLYAVDAYKGEVVVINRQGVFDRRIKLAGEVTRYFGEDLYKKYPWFRFGIVDAVVVENGDLLVVDNPCGWIYVLDSTDKLVNVIGEKGYKAGLMQYPTFTDLDSAGRVLVSDTLNSRVQVFDPGGASLGVIGEKGLGIGQFLRPKGLATGVNGNIFVADSQLNVVQVFDENGGFISLLGDERGLPLDLGSPNGLVFVEPDLLMISEKLSRRIQVRKVLDVFLADTIQDDEPQKNILEERIFAPSVQQPTGR